MNNKENSDQAMSPNDVRMTLTGSIIDINFNNDNTLKDISETDI